MFEQPAFYRYELQLPDPIGSDIELLLGPAFSPADSLLLLHYIDPGVAGWKAFSSTVSCSLVSESMLWFLLSCSLLSETGILFLGLDRLHLLAPHGSDLNLMLGPGDSIGVSVLLLLSDPGMWPLPSTPSCCLLSDIVKLFSGSDRQTFMFLFCLLLVA